MKEVAILLLVALMLNGCSNSTAVQTAVSGGWQAEMLGGDGLASGFSFITQWTVSGGNGALSVSNFQFLTQIDGGCFPVTGETPTGNLKVTFNAADQVTGTFSFIIASVIWDAGWMRGSLLGLAAFCCPEIRQKSSPALKSVERSL